MKFPLKYKTALLILAIIAATSIVATIISSSVIRNIGQDSFTRQAVNLANTNAVSIDGDSVGKIDLNNLKKMNDTYGHDKGDISISRLCGVADKIFSHSKIFRIGGDEFVVILEGEDYENRDERIAGFNAEMEKIRKDDQLTPWKQISAAIGCAVFDPAADTDTEDVFRRADSIMYANKKRMKSGKA